MSTSDSDYSIDWLASDEDDEDSPKTSSPQQEQQEQEEQPPPSSWSARRSGCCRCRDGERRGVEADSQTALQTPTLHPVQGFTSEQLSVTRLSARKRVCEQTPADTQRELFSQKVSELRCYLQPLSSILQGLASGRYSQRLSSFQESVAMDRIQRIMGVLQNPTMGGRFLSIVLKIEEMLQSWFPHVRPHLLQADSGSTPKKHKHCSSSSSPPPSAVSLCSSSPPPSAVSLCSSDSSTRLRWLHTAPICSLKTPQHSPGVSSPPPQRLGQDVTQDNAVSSSTDSPSSDSPLTSAPRGAPPFKIRSPCLERLLRAKDSIIAPRTAGDEGWLL